jgi:hypothetical protein
MIVASVPGVLLAAVAVWFNLRKGNQELRKGAEQIRLGERDNVVHHLQNHVREREEIHRRDMERVEAQLGHLARKLEDCEDRHGRLEVINAKLMEFLRGKGLMSATEEMGIFDEGGSP